MTKEELLKPRYKVIADYPINPFSVGDIFTFDYTEDYLNDKGVLGTWLDKNNNVFIESVQKFPNLFKKLEWWEDRKESEMPEYVKIIDENIISKIDSYLLGVGFEFTATNYYATDYKRKKVFSLNTIPATKEEYNNQN